MNPDVDPNKFGELVKQANTPPAKPVVEEQRPITIPGIIKYKMDNSEFCKDHLIISDILRYYVIPSAQSGFHKAVTACVDFFIMGRDLKPSTNKKGNIYIYADGNKEYNDYSSYSQSDKPFQATYVNSRTRTVDKYRGSSKASYIQIPHFDENGNQIPWTEPEIEAMSEQILDHLQACIEASDFASVQDFYEACGQGSAPATANKFGWPSIAKLTIAPDINDSSVLIVRIPGEPVEIDKVVKNDKEN